MANLLYIDQRRLYFWKISCICFFFLLFSVTAYAQNISGKVVDSENEGLEGANIILVDSAKHIVCFSITASDGRYQLVLPANTTPVEMKVTLMGYQSMVFPMKNVRNNMTIRLTGSEFQLKEVKVRASKIVALGDTLSYSVAAFKQGQDRSIADVIAKMPGLEVKSNGQIEYQGKAINKFYIEGLDLMGAQYGIANKNISADKVRSVQILQNHQPITSLRGVSFSEQAALNIVLKDNAKDVFGGLLEIGQGYGDKYLWENRLMGMRFGRNNQVLAIYKDNNIGMDVTSEFNPLIRSEQTAGSQEYEHGILSLMRIGDANIDKERYTFNTSHLVAGNWLHRINKVTDLRFQVSGLIDKERLRNYQSSSYLTIIDTPSIVEKLEGNNWLNKWKGEVDYQMNGVKTFLKNNLRVSMNLDKGLGVMNYNGKNTDISVKPHKYSFTDEFKLLHTCASGAIYEINSLFAYVCFPGALLTIKNRMQSLNMECMSSYNSLLYKLKLGNNYFNNEVGVDYERQYLSCDIDSQKQSASVCNYFIRAFYKPSYVLNYGNLRLNMAAKFNLLHQSLYSRKANLTIDARISSNWKMSAVSSVSALFSYVHKPLMLRDISTIPIYVNYRTIVKNSGENNMTQQWGFSLGYQYVEPLNGLFFHVRPFCNVNSGKPLFSNRLEDGVLYRIASNENDRNASFGLMSRMAKFFGWAGMFLGIGVMVQTDNYSILMAEQVDKARMLSSTYELNYSLRPLMQLSFEGKTELHCSKQQNLTKQEMSSDNQILDWSHELNCFVFPADKWMFSIKNQLFHSNDKSLSTNYYCDLSISYKTKRWELSVMCYNIMNTKEFRKSVLSETMNVYSITYLRSRNIMIKYTLDL